MSVTRKALAVTAAKADRREWTRPTVRRLAADSAEDAAGTVVDGFNLS